MQRMFLLWLRTFFDIDESRLRLRLYLHESLDFEVASAFWEEVTGIPRSQHTLPYRAEENPSIRKVKHPMGCPRVVYSCAATHRLVMGMVAALLSCNLLPG